MLVWGLSLQQAAQVQRQKSKALMDRSTIVCMLSANIDKLIFFVYLGDGDDLTLGADDRAAFELDSEDAISLLME